MQLEELVKLTVHHLYRLVGAIDDGLEQLASLHDRHLSLLLLLMCQVLERCIKVVLNLHIDLRYDILFLISDKVNELKALLPA